MIKTLATAVALILTLSIATTAFAQNQTGATGLQIQVVPQIQRGHQQHLTVFSVDDQGNEVNASEIQSTITNAKGNLVGPKTLYTQSGETVSYKVGPNTAPQNITIDSCLTEQDLCATQSYSVFPKGQAQVPLPLPPVMPEPELPEANNTGEGEIVVPANETEVTTPEGGNETLPEQPVPELPAENVTVEAPTEPVPFPPINETISIPPAVEIPVEGNDTTTAPEAPIVIVPENETSVVTPDNATEGGIEIPINDTSVVIPSNETTVPEPTTNDTEVIVAPSNETEIVTGDNASEVPQIPDDIVDQIEDPVVIVPGNETTVGENTTTTTPIPIEPEPEPTLPVDVNVTVPADGNVTVEAPGPGNITVGVETPNGTVPLPLPEPETPDEAVEVVENATETLDQAVEGGNVDEIIAAMQQAIQAQQAIVSVVQEATDEERAAASDAVNNLNELISEAMSEVSGE